ncbi:MAG: FliH/SctL family protein [Burkholderiaceae bacterium]|jgi:flagellar assembly protein FliH
MPSYDRILRGGDAALLRTWNIADMANLTPAAQAEAAELLDQEATQRALQESLRQAALDAEQDRQAALEKAREEGFDAGYDAGWQQAGQERQQLVRLGTTLSEEIEQLHEHLGEAVLRLALQTARRVVLDSIAIQPDGVAVLLNQALDGLKQPLRQLVVQAHPDCTRLLRAQFGDGAELGGLRIVEDASLAIGGFRLQYADGDLDMSVESRWERVVGTLTRDTALTDWQTTPAPDGDNAT